MHVRCDPSRHGCMTEQLLLEWTRVDSISFILVVSYRLGVRTVGPNTVLWLSFAQMLRCQCTT